MRVATLIIGLVLSVGLFIQSVLVAGLSSLGDDKQMQASGAAGFWMAFLWVVAAALVIAFPRVSLVLFVLAALLGFAGADHFPDLWIWGSGSLILALFSYLGYLGKRHEQAKQDALLDTANAVRAALATPAIRSTPPRIPAAATQIYCSQCGAPNPTTARFCSACGERLDADALPGLDAGQADL